VKRYLYKTPAEIYHVKFVQTAEMNPSVIDYTILLIHISFKRSSASG